MAWPCFEYRRSTAEPHYSVPAPIDLHVGSDVRANLVPDDFLPNCALTVGPAFPFYEAAPPVGKDILTFSAEFHPTGVSLAGVFLGATWSFRDRFEKLNILGCRDADSDQYVRVLQDLDLTTESSTTWFVSTLLDGALHNMAPPDHHAAAS